MRSEVVLFTAVAGAVFLAFGGARERRAYYCNEEKLEKREEHANMVFTGTVKSLYRKHHYGNYKGAVRVKRVLKGDSDLAENIVMVDGFGNPHICYSDVRENDTRIFLVSHTRNGHLKLNSSLVRVSVNNLDRTMAAVKDKPFERRRQITENPCEQMFCAHGALCLVDEKSRQAYCRCQEVCTDIFAPVCGSDGVTYSSECQLRMASCTQQRRIFVQHQGPCDMKDPCQDKACDFGAQCKPSLDGRTSECVCPNKCATYGDSRGSRPVCGTDGRDYPNVCELRRTACREMRNVQVKFQGRCDPCEGVECPASQVCQLDENRNPICRCNAICSPDFRPVCGSDGKTYTNECSLRVEACKSRRSLRIIYTGECSSGANPCENLQCGPGQECDIDRYGIATCQCPGSCELVMRPVCGTDEKTYDSQCELKRQACIRKQNVDVDYRGECGMKGPCTTVRCSHEAMCIIRNGEPTCECATCSGEFQPVCGSDGISYNNECKLKREACEQKTTIGVSYNGLCNGCENKKCEFYAVCESDGQGEAKCICPQFCAKMEAPVCGTDGITYTNECEMRVSACKKQQYAMVASKGPCDLCVNVHCKYGARCENGHCVCPTDCPNAYEPVCANDGATYPNECEMRRASCQDTQELRALFYGECEDLGSSGLDFGSGMKTCEDKACSHGGLCEHDSEGQPFCACHFQCPSVRDPICGSDGRLYDNDCKLREQACKQQQQVKPVSLERCKDHHVVPCDGEKPLVDPLTGKEYSCGEGSNLKSCPPSSYCHKSSTFAKCCREVLMIKNCADAAYGCCPDGKTTAQGENHAGCPSVCNCNRLGSYDQTCDPTSKQCPCKPGVGGLRCDRCEPGFWGLHKIAEGNSGCVPCSCNVYGSVRDDCEQMTGRCVCRHGIQGMKCDVCPANTVLGPEGCTDVSISRSVPGSCDQLSCHHGATCREKDGRAQCICDFHCVPEESRSPVCGSDGNTYGSECQLKLFGCRYQKPINLRNYGPCKREAGGITPTAAPARRSTVQKMAPDETKSTRDIPLSLPENLYLSTRPTASAPVKHNEPIEIPAFSGRSYLEMQRLQAYTRLSLEMEFRTFTNYGILLYNGQTSTGAGDFVSLAIKDGYIEFRYNLGSGPVVLRSPQRLQTGRYHRLVAKRYMKDGMLTVDGEEDVAGKSDGTLKSLDLGENLFLGWVPTENKGVFENIGVSTGFVGCIRKLRIGRKEMNLGHPLSKDVIRSHMLGECANSPCSSLPCQNGATCTIEPNSRYRCICQAGFTGRECDMTLDSCSSNPCREGSTCLLLPKGGFSCKCPPGKTGILCDLMHKEMYDVFVPDFNGHAYLELPTLQNVGQAFSLELWFLTRSPEGMLLYNGQLMSGRGDFVSLNLINGYVEFRYDLGSGIANVSTTKAVTLNRWHSVKVTRIRREGSIQLDDSAVVKGESKPPLSELNLEQPLLLGGFSSPGRINRDSGIQHSLDGAIQRLIVNSEVWDDLADRAVRSVGVRKHRGPPCDKTVCHHGGVCVPELSSFSCKCPMKYMGKYCEKHVGQEELQRSVSFDGKTFLSYPNKIVRRVDGQSENRFEVKFRTKRENGLLLWTNKGVTTRGDYLALAIVDGYVELSYNLGTQREPLVIRNPLKVDDGKWHVAKVERKKRMGTLRINGKDPATNISEPGATELNTDGIIWIGGSTKLPEGLPGQYYYGFSGCVDYVTIDGDPLHLVLHGSPEVHFCPES